MIRSTATLVLVLVLAPATARTATWEIDPAHSSVQFSVRHMMVSNVRGHFAKFAGHVDGDAANPTAVRVVATIDTASIDTGNAKRDEHLRGPEFLDVAKFPTMTFTSKKVEKAGDGWKVTGDLTLHGVTREIVLDVSDVTAPIRDPLGNLRAGGEARTKLNRQDFGISYSKTLDGGGVVVGDEITVTIDVEVMQKAGAPPAH